MGIISRAERPAVKPRSEPACGTLPPQPDPRKLWGLGLALGLCPTSGPGFSPRRWVFAPCCPQGERKFQVLL